MGNKNLLICPFCLKKGIKNVLGEIDKSGNLLVKRYAQSYTIIESKDLKIKCSCGELVYFKI
jgi:hypothetical protein